MPADDLGLVVALVVAATCASGCAGNPVPKPWRPAAAAAQRSSHGGWIRIEAPDDSNRTSDGRSVVEGELIAIDETAFHVLSSTGLQSVPRDPARRITLTGYGNRAGALAGWTVAGGISTLSHGGFLLLTAPMWAVTGIVSAVTEAHAGTWHDDELASRFARFPQGLPPGLDPKALGALSETPHDR